MTKVLMTIRFHGKSPTLGQVQERYSLSDEEVDHDFGLVEIDPDEHLYTLMVEESAARKIRDDGEWEVKGPYANVRIAPFGPPEAEE